MEDLKMEALISFTNETSSNLFKELKREKVSVMNKEIRLLKQKLENAIWSHVKI